MSWECLPPYSPDLNPAENLISYLEWHIESETCVSKDELLAKINDAVLHCDRQVLKNLCVSMAERVSLISAANGRTIKKF